jgi:hypothetical protein
MELYNNDMSEYTNKPTKDIQSEMTLLEMDYTNLKSKVISMLDQLDAIEKKYEIASNELKKRGVNDNKN